MNYFFTLFVLISVGALFFALEEAGRKKSFIKNFFSYFPPLIWIYAVPLLLSSSGVIPKQSPIYSSLSTYFLPAVIVLMLIPLDIKTAVTAMGRAVGVMLVGTLGVVVGGPIAYLIVGHYLPPDAWKAFGALAGSWIGGTGNMAATAQSLDLPGESPLFGLAIITDHMVYTVWLPILLISKRWDKKFREWAGTKTSLVDSYAEIANRKSEYKLKMQHFLYLAAISMGAVYISIKLAEILPKAPPVLTSSTWKILIVTTIGIALSFTPLRKMEVSHELSLALIYIFVASMGARASLEGIEKAPFFILGGFIWISIHGIFCLAAARALKVDISSVAIASAANIGGAASAPIVASFHNELLVPAAIIMALIGYALGNYMAFITGHLCRILFEAVYG